MSHRNAPLSPEGRRRLIDRCQNRPIAHVAAETGISRACASKWVNRFRRHGDLGLLDRWLALHPVGVRVRAHPEQQLHLPLGRKTIPE
ncbi:leucine zipper domain-containing protein [Streptomyces sp. NPDC001027]|uniref:helix-turn-helix domain-containing protein n=1 Tax=Streptomyces sp. NPDC001027 TaxID=3154771 RepID=UPI003324FE23